MTIKTSFSCGESLCIRDAVSLQARLQKSLQKSSTVELNADAVQKVDTAGLQLFIAISREVSGSNGTLIWKKPSEVLIAAAARLGLDKELGLS